jgi:hypothetical protein
VITTVVGAGVGYLLGGIIGMLVRTGVGNDPSSSVSIGQVETKAEFTIAFTIPFR